MGNMKKIIATIATAAVTVGILAFPAQATTVVAPLAGETVVSGPWTVSTLASDHDGWTVESYKVDRDLVAWTEVNVALKQRQLMTFDGVSAKTLATIPFSDWEDSDISTFVDPVAGSYDAADGLVVWVQRDGTSTNDREIFGYDGAKTYQVSTNTYDDRHPVTSRGRVAWTSAPGSQSYNLMLRDLSLIHISEPTRPY